MAKPGSLPAILQIPYTFWISITFVVTMIAAFLLLMPVQLLPGKAAHATSNFILARWANLWSILIFIWFTQKGREKHNTRETAVLVSNHSSYLDTVAAYYLTKHRFKTLAKKSLLKIPILGLIFRTSGIMVDRSSAESRKQSYERMVNAVKGGTSVLIFPEGTQNRTKEPLTPFYDGAFRLAIAAGVPLIPIVCENAGRLMPQAQVGKIRPGVVRHHYLDAISTEGMTEEDVDMLKDLAFERMRAKIVSLNQGK